MLRFAATDLRREWRLALTQPCVSTTFVVIGCLTMLALLTGWLRTNSRIERLQTLAGENAQQQRFVESAFLERPSTDSAAAELAGELTPAEHDRRLSLQMSARSPDLMRYTEGLWRSMLPTTPLTGLSQGAGGEWPDHYYHAGPSTTQTLARTMRPNPLLTTMGAFDLTLVVGVVLPLAVIVLTYDVTAADRELGRWEFVRCHTSSIHRLIVARCLVRVGASSLLVIMLTALFVIVLPTGHWDSAMIRNFLIWSAWVSAYLGFWAALSILANSLKLSWAGAGLLLLLCWCIFVFAIPALLQCAVNWRIQMPRQAELTALEEDVRKQVEREADDVWADFLREHPQIEIDDEKPQQEVMLRDVALNKAARSEVEARVETYLQRFLHREDLLDRSQLLTPLLAWRTAADQSAGTSLRHFVEFARQTGDFHDEHAAYFESKSLAGQELSFLDIQGIPRFDDRQFYTQLDLSPLLLSAASLLMWTSVCGLLSWWCLRLGTIQ